MKRVRDAHHYIAAKSEIKKKKKQQRDIRSSSFTAGHYTISSSVIYHFLNDSPNKLFQIVRSWIMIMIWCVGNSNWFYSVAALRRKKNYFHLNAHHKLSWTVPYYCLRWKKNRIRSSQIKMNIEKSRFFCLAALRMQYPLSTALECTVL